jgi:AcrR family transcriptional regulator
MVAQHDPDTAGIRARPAGARSDRIHDKALSATAELLDEGGFAATSMDAVAARSGVSKTTLYNHWPSRTALAACAFGKLMAEALPLPDTGNLESDVVAHLRQVSQYYDSPRGRIFAQLLAACVDDPEGALYFREYFLAGRRAEVARMWKRGVDRGEIDSEVDVEDFIDLLSGPLVFRRMGGHVPLTATRAETLARLAVRAVTA